MPRTLFRHATHSAKLGPLFRRWLDRSTALYSSCMNWSYAEETARGFWEYGKKAGGGGESTSHSDCISAASDFLADFKDDTSDCREFNSKYTTSSLERGFASASLSVAFLKWVEPEIFRGGLLLELGRDRAFDLMRSAQMWRSSLAGQFLFRHLQMVRGEERGSGAGGEPYLSYN
ncbi:hypothetical protein O181_086770 [Austropuccinia psidii MF-1]|uniref:Uncharacterized protein n=1 Tax=Austropuccinia psidii MF-1 TaxID=1389203 RepID=A0A9Q3FZU7_9BASI|nr:hypothetical protein [Austropuccinia psidii MF-1]